MFILAAPSANWGWDFLYGILSTLDSIIYGMVSVVTQGFFNVAYVQIFSADTIQDITGRIYVVLAVFMIFKLAFSLIQYLVNPDQVNDKTAGMGKLVSRTATAFIMLIAVPIIFDEFLFGPEAAKDDPSKSYQAIIARSIPRIIIGSSDDGSQGADMGNTMAAIALSAFVQPNTECTGSDGSTPEELGNKTIADIAESVTKRCSDVTSGGDNSIYGYEYQIGLSTVIGLVMLVIMLFFTVDIAIRTIKLGILRVIAPIPIMTYIDPKSSKDGAFSNWLKALISTFLELFIKVAIIYIIIYIIIQLTKTDGKGIQFGGLNGLEKTWAMIFIIIGLLLFTIQATSFIKNIFGIKDGGGSAGIGALLGGAGALLAGGGIAGLAQGMATGATEGGQGKIGINNFNKGKDLASKTAKGKATAALKEQKRMQKQADKVGYTKEHLDNLQTEAETAANELKMAEAEYQHDPSAANKAKLQEAMAKNSAATTTYEKAKKIAENPWLAQKQGKAFTKSQYALELAKHAVGSQVNAAVSPVAAWASNTGIYTHINNHRKEAEARNEPYEKDRLSGGAYLHSSATSMDEYLNPPTLSGGNPSAPGGGNPSAPGGGNPSAPGGGNSSAPGSGNPSAPGGGNPSAPGSGNPSAPGGGNSSS